MAAVPPPRLILASRSPRRASLLREAGYVFDVLAPAFEDPPSPQKNHDSPGQIAMRLAAQKAFSALDLVPRAAAPALILAADTLCVAPDGALVGTPVTLDEARTMIRAFRNAEHQVITGIALHTPAPPRRTPTPPDLFADAADVALGQVSDDQLEAYLDSGEWRGKAGGYNLFDRRQAGWPIVVRGDPTTVVGLPMRRLGVELAGRGIHRRASS